tara:strand:+ start:1299 stop:1778 length:480 start_codon:yes stop_codon:yes gene_type:complete
MAFKMKGFSYPGQSPLKGKKKQARIAAAKEDRLTAQAKTDEFGDMEMKSTNILDSQGFSIQGGGVAPFKDQDADENEADAVENEADAVENEADAVAPKKTFKESFKGAMGSEMGKTAGNALATAGVNAIVGVLTKPKKEKPKRQAANMSGFSNIKMGRK